MVTTERRGRTGSPTKQDLLVGRRSLAYVISVNICIGDISRPSRSARLIVQPDQGDAGEVEPNRQIAERSRRPHVRREPSAPRSSDVSRLDSYRIGRHRSRAEAGEQAELSPRSSDQKPRARRLRRRQSPRSSASPTVAASDMVATWLSCAEARPAGHCRNSSTLVDDCCRPERSERHRYTGKPEDELQHRGSARRNARTSARSTARSKKPRRCARREDEGEDSELGNLLRAWDRASQGAREKFKARVGLVAVEPPAKAMDDGLDIPEFLRRAAP